MTLKDLWHSFVAKASAEEQALAAQFHEHIEALDADLTEAIPFKEFPKWVDGKVVNSQAEEDALKAPAETVHAAAPAPVVETPPAPPAPSPAPEPAPGPGASTEEVAK
ncbi:MAG: hypothetical protein PVS3B2_00320 [Candidatus Dormibacteraceae bacterium]